MDLIKMNLDQIFKYKPSTLFKKLIHSPVVKSGPFEGMYFPAESSSSAKFPKLAGTYEKEISHLFTPKLLNNYDVFIDIGAAEGYYAIGVARLMQTMNVIAYEADTKSRIWLDYLSKENGVRDRIDINGICTSITLFQEINKYNSPLVLIDIEGGEYELLDDHIVPVLSNADIILEVHDFIFPHMKTEMIRRFDRSHYIMEVSQTKRSFKDLHINFNYLQRLTFKRAIEEITNEKRPAKMSWLYMTKRI